MKREKLRSTHECALQLCKVNFNRRKIELSCLSIKLTNKERPQCYEVTPIKQWMTWLHHLPFLFLVSTGVTEWRELVFIIRWNWDELTWNKRSLKINRLTKLWPYSVMWECRTPCTLLYDVICDVTRVLWRLWYDIMEKHTKCDIMTSSCDVTRKWQRTAASSASALYSMEDDPL